MTTHTGDGSQFNDNNDYYLWLQIHWTLVGDKYGTGDKNWDILT